MEGKGIESRTWLLWWVVVVGIGSSRWEVDPSLGHAVHDGLVRHVDVHDHVDVHLPVLQSLGLLGVSWESI